MPQFFGQFNFRIARELGRRLPGRVVAVQSIEHTALHAWRVPARISDAKQGKAFEVLEAM
jgi:hypothetical protein